MTDRPQPRVRPAPCLRGWTSSMHGFAPHAASTPPPAAFQPGPVHLVRPAARPRVLFPARTSPSGIALGSHALGRASTAVSPANGDPRHAPGPGSGGTPGPGAQLHRRRER
jgi:hypothetical protein